MATIQVVLDKELLQAANKAARQTKLNRSAFVREALRQHLQRLELRSKDDRDREGYLRKPQSVDEMSIWEAQAFWPAD